MTSSASESFLWPAGNSRVSNDYSGTVPIAIGRRQAVRVGLYRRR